MKAGLNIKIRHGWTKDDNERAVKLKVATCGCGCSFSPETTKDDDEHTVKLKVATCGCSFSPVTEKAR